jgi:hypothetical protein
MPFANTEAMNAHLAEIAGAVSPDAHALLVLDGAGWHGAGGLIVPPNITLLSPRALSCFSVRVVLLGGVKMMFQPDRCKRRLPALPLAG